MKKVFVAKTVQWCLINCVRAVLGHGVATRGAQVTVPRWLLRLCVVACLRTCMHLQKCRTASELTFKGAKPPLKSSISLKTVKTGSEYMKFDIWSQGIF